MILYSESEQLACLRESNHSLREQRDRLIKQLADADDEIWKQKQINFDLQYPGVLDKLKKNDLLNSMITI